MAESGALVSELTESVPPSGAPKPPSGATSTERAPRPSGILRLDGPRGRLITEPPSTSTDSIDGTLDGPLSGALAALAAAASAGAAAAVRLLPRADLGGEGSGERWTSRGSPGSTAVGSPPCMAASAAPKSTRKPEPDGVRSAESAEGDLRHVAKGRRWFWSGNGRVRG